MLLMVGVTASILMAVVSVTFLRVKLTLFPPLSLTVASPVKVNAVPITRPVLSSFPKPIL